MNTFVFIGPTLAVDKAREVLHAEYLPPVAMGDIVELVETRAQPGDVIAIIDGVFEQVPAVWHKEILFAMSKGIHVYGASSMGALRAAELHSFGMIGVGRIFKAFRDGVLEDDDEVTVSHATAEQGFRALSDSMASIRFGLQQLNEQQIISQAQYQALEQHAKQTHYTVRNWGDVIAHATTLGLTDVQLDALRELAVNFDAKRNDALELLGQLKSLQDAQTGDIKAVEYTLQNTVFWQALRNLKQGQVATAKLSDDAHHDVDNTTLANHARAFFSENGLIDQALLLKIAFQVTRDTLLDSVDLKQAMARVCRKLAITNNASLKQWMTKQKVTPAQWQNLIELDAKLHKFRQAHLPDIEPFIVAALKHSGQFADVELSAKRRQDAIALTGANKLTFDLVNIDSEQLQQWYERYVGSMGGNPELHAQQLGFDTLRDFVDELLGTYLVQQTMTEQASSAA